MRRTLFVAFAGAFTVPYFKVLNRVDVVGRERLNALPKRGVVFLSNHQTYFTEAIAFFDAVYRRRGIRWEDPYLRFSAAEETMRKNLATSLLTTAGAVLRAVPPPRGSTSAVRSTSKASGASNRRSAPVGSCTSPPARRGRGPPSDQACPGCCTALRRLPCQCASTASGRCCSTSRSRGASGAAPRSASTSPLDLTRFYEQPYTPEAGAQSPPGSPTRSATGSGAPALFRFAAGGFESSSAGSPCACDQCSHVNWGEPQAHVPDDDGGHPQLHDRQRVHLVERAPS